MRKQWLAIMLAGWLADSAGADADKTIHVAVTWHASPAESAEIATITQVAASTPRKDFNRTERPTELPNIDPRLDIKPLVAPPAKPKPEPMRTMPIRDRLFGPDYDPSLLFLPDRNPGVRQPPCPCLPLGKWWVNSAYFLGKTESDSIPPLLAVGGNGVPGTPGVTTIYGQERLKQPFRSGMRLELGSWLDRCHNWGVDSSFFFMQSTRVEYQAASDGDPLLARPYLAQPWNLPAVDVLAAPGQRQGSFSASSPMTFIGADVNSRHTYACEDKYRIDWLAGYRYIRMSEEILMHSHSNSIDGWSQDIDESFRTVNAFHGGQIGFTGEYRFDRIYVGCLAKVAFGATWSTLQIEGQTQTQFVGTNTTPGGLMATPNVLGTLHERNFAVVPEANFTIGYQVGDHWRAYLGYTFVYVSSVARPGQALDLLSRGPSLPSSDINTDFWMHGINLGLEARY